ncbi:MAG: quinol:electron acceptor oxidoreductase subunit ActD [Nitrospira sp.]
MAPVTGNNRMVLALFEPSGDPKSLVEKLRKAGVPEDAVEVLSPLPLQEAALLRPARVPLHRITIMAGLVGIGLGIMVAAGTALLYPIVTGGKPIVALPVVGIIAFETMMLMAIVTTFAAMLIQLRSESRNATERDPRIDDGLIEVILSLPPDSPRLETVQALLQEAGALEIRHRHPPPSVPHGAEREGQATAAFFVAACLVCGVQACSRDMQEQPSYQPQEAPRLHSPVGSVPRDSRAVRKPLPTQQVFDEGARLFRINCSHCHGRDGTGHGPVITYLKEKPADLLDPDVQALSEEALYDTVTYGLAVEGRDVMPPFKGEMSAEERHSVVAYVKSLSQS